MNLPAVLILMACTSVLVIGIRESAASNTALVLLKLGVVVFVIVVGIGLRQLKPTGSTFRRRHARRRNRTSSPDWPSLAGGEHVRSRRRRTLHKFEKNGRKNQTKAKPRKRTKPEQ